jgi:heme/copper-type cytochrome/quinol oxidase subunit 2
MRMLIAVLLHDEAVDIIYFWASILMVALPITVFGMLTYFVVRASRKPKHGAESTEQNPTS